ncbi:hypothetical protein [Methanogenium cariaci]|nr:hypothetical protein [Methanogenium cariaci]
MMRFRSTPGMDQYRPSRTLKETELRNRLCETEPGNGNPEE